MSRYKIAVVVQGFMQGGGVASTANFIINLLNNNEKYDVELILAATAFNDSLSVRLLSPGTWFKGVKIQDNNWEGFQAYAVGANLSELEFRRYLPRPRVTQLLNQYHLIQVVSGSPALAAIANNAKPPVCLFFATLARLERQAYLKTTGLIRRLYTQMNLPIVSRIEIQALRQCKHIFAETEYTKQAILPHVEASRISTDTVSVDTQRFIPLSDEQRADNYILSVGRFSDARKNVAMLIEAYGLLRQRIPDAPKLVLAGKSSPLPLVWQRAKALGIDQYIVLKLDVLLDELVELYQHASVYALSSDEEGLGIVLLEAMACATPVVSTRCGGPDSVVSDDVGFLVPVGDAEAMADRLFWLLTNPDQRREMGQNGREMVERRFSNEVIGQKYLDTYDQILDS